MKLKILLLLILGQCAPGACAGSLPSPQTLYCRTEALFLRQNIPDILTYGSRPLSGSRAPVTRSAYPHTLLAQSPTPTPDPPKSSLVSERDLVGTWLHVGTSETLGGKQKEMAPVEIKWKLEPGGRGTFSQRISVSATPWVSQLSWGLDGDTILLDGGRDRYTIVRPGAESMVWKNQAVGNYYHVRRLP